MKIALIGHRGVGKTSCLKRIEAYHRGAGRDVLCLDLDREIATHEGRTVSEIFSELGEPEFRRLERETFARISASLASEHRDVYLALGAGFDVSSLPREWKALWIRRASDANGRAFTDRPRLNRELSAMDEYRERFLMRDKLYRSRADETLFLEEGADQASKSERGFFLDELDSLGGALTVFQEDLRADTGAWFAKRMRWGVARFELRDDLLTTEEIQTVLSLIPGDRALLSFREPSARARTALLAESHRCLIDWPLELTENAPVPPSILSLHERLEGQSISDALKRLSSADNGRPILKAALPIKDFAELREGHHWWCVDKKRRSFLPLSPDGRWNWYREWMAPFSVLSFFREAEGSGADQPTLLRWAERMHLRAKDFAAVLGDPVTHSFTPLEQREFFAARSAPVFAIRVRREEWATALDVLEELGLRWAAVTSPVKDLALAICDHADSLALEMRAVNTLVRQGADWFGTNTDREGFEKAWRETVGGEERATAVWGGGGTLGVLSSVLPGARLFSARTGKPRDNSCDSGFEPRVLIWAAGRADLMPPSSWRPEIVMDLSYSEDSPARSFADESGARYVSGLQMFRAQAAAQRRFWQGMETQFKSIPEMSW